MPFTAPLNMSIRLITGAAKKKIDKVNN